MSRRRIPVALQKKIREQARFRCGYCLTSETLIGMKMEFEHLTPLAADGETSEENLWLACRRCNEFKGTQTHAIDAKTATNVPLFNPRTQKWHEHFRWSADGTEILGISPNGRASVTALKLNNEIILVSRRLWVSVGWFPPED